MRGVWLHITSRPRVAQSQLTDPTHSSLQVTVQFTEVYHSPTEKEWSWGLQERNEGGETGRQCKRTTSTTPLEHRERHTRKGGRTERQRNGKRKGEKRGKKKRFGRSGGKGGEDREGAGALWDERQRGGGVRVVPRPNRRGKTGKAVD